MVPVSGRVRYRRAELAGFFAVRQHPGDTSGAFAKTAVMMIERLIRGTDVEERAYYREHPPEMGWGWMLLVGIVIGSFLSA